LLRIRGVFVKWGWVEFLSHVNLLIRANVPGLPSFPNGAYERIVLAAGQAGY